MDQINALGESKIPAEGLPSAAAAQFNTNGPPRESLVQFMAPELVEDGDTRTTRDGRKKTPVAVEILNSIIPPREWTNEDGSRVRQRVSIQPSSRDDVLTLQLKLDEQLQHRQARESGICPVREELYSQAFDELIRQVAIESSERGLLMQRVRDEVRMTLASYQTLYQSSITFGTRKTLQAEQANSGLSERIEELEATKKRLTAQLQDQRALYDFIEKRIQEQRSAEDKRNQEEKDFLKFQVAFSFCVLVIA